MGLVDRLRARFRAPPGALLLVFLKEGAGWMTRNLPKSFDGGGVDVSAVRRRAEATGRLGAKPLWDGYRAVEDYPRDTVGSRSSDQVRTSEDLGAFYAWLAIRRRPAIIVEFGTAFGVSGMYWLTGLEGAATGVLMTYEPNDIWAAIASDNLRAISPRFTLTSGTFEDNAGTTLAPGSVDIAFIDAIHTSAFVFSQFGVLKPFLTSGALVLFDDINFSDDMRQCWDTIALAPEVLASARIGDRVGIVELA